MIVILLCLGVALSQFYVFKSGIPQPAHYLIALALIGALISRSRIIIPRSGQSTLQWLFAFVVYQAAVNSIYFSINNDFDFLMQAIYIIYGFMTFVLISNLFLIKAEFFGKIPLSCLLGLLVLFALPLLGLGEYRFSPRYNAFFNDPNQMAFWVLCVAAISILYYGNSGHLILTAVIFLAAAFLIFLTASRSGLVGFVILALGFFAGYLRGFEGVVKFKQIAAYLIGIFIASYGVYYFLNTDSDAISFLLSRVDIIDAGEQARIRGYTRIFEYPEYIIFGAGHGMEGRFNAEGTEIHSTWAGIVFYYGMPGIFLFLAVLYSIFKKLALNEKLFFLAPLFYSFSTFGLRTPIFWIFLGFFYMVILKKQNELNSNAQTRPHHFPRPLPSAFPRPVDPQAASPGHSGAGAGAQL